MKFRSFILITFLSLAATLLISSLVFAQQPTPAPYGGAPLRSATPSDDEVNAVARGLYCPVCENIPLDVCPTTACAQWRALIKEKLTQGWSAQQIDDYFVAQYGDRVLAQPPVANFNWVFWVGMFVLIIAAVAIFIFAVILPGRRKLSVEKPNAAPPVEPPATDREYLSRLEEELKKRD